MSTLSVSGSTLETANERLPAGAGVLKGRRVAFVGCGTMAEAIMSILLKGKLIQPDQIAGSEPVGGRRAELSAKYGVHLVESNREAAAGADVVLLTIKPQSLDQVMRDLAGSLGEQQIVVSIVPGATLERLAKGLQHPAVVRSMPNTPAQIGYGATVWCASPAVNAEHEALVTTILGAMGTSVRVDSDEAVDMATALSGTGPAYIFLVMEALIDAGVHMGFARRTAEELVHQTILGSVLFARESGRHPAELRNMVTTPAGTTAAALYEMEKGGLRTVISRSVWAAFKRAQELGRGRRSHGPDDL
jgi:pyrroline-5-carboxylate reductase